MAGALFSFAERDFNRKVAAILEGLGYYVFLPQNIATTDEEGMFAELLANLEISDIVVAICDGTQADDGTSWELGYAFAKNIPSVLLRTDFRKHGDSGHFNLMLKASSSELAIVKEESALEQCLRESLVNVEYLYLSGK